MVFAREINAPLTSLVKKIDAATAQHSKEKMGSFVVLLSDSEGMDKKLKELAEKEKISKTTLTLDTPAGPSGYNVAKAAEVTVILYVEKTVKVNYAFKKGELNDAAISKIIADLPKILDKAS